ncbi:hypothetical protein pdam_00018480 [Pocillopora damicornis]|uniref:Uncharacterized protein n=2 Tax=Pocillopora TaxID=46730 RepID=A0A3M6UE70_POCDA|nr:hypothetical protein pdam_00018480 [Pocillopora damicornis]CAH3031349.1 unnamed protein product [Pocillopora meandrina]
MFPKSLIHLRLSTVNTEVRTLQEHTSGFFAKADLQLKRMVEDFYNQDFTDSIVDDSRGHWSVALPARGLPIS